MTPPRQPPRNRAYDIHGNPFRMTGGSTPKIKHNDNSEFWNTVAVLFVGWPSLLILEGLIARTIWNWFVPVIFRGAPLLGVAQAIGLSFVASMLVRSRSRKDKDQDLWDPLIDRLINSLTVLFMAFIVQFFV